MQGENAAPAAAADDAPDNVTEDDGNVVADSVLVLLSHAGLQTPSLEKRALWRRRTIEHFVELQFHKIDVHPLFVLTDPEFGHF